MKYRFINIIKLINLLFFKKCVREHFSTTFNAIYTAKNSNEIKKIKSNQMMQSVFNWIWYFCVFSFVRFAWRTPNCQLVGNWIKTGKTNLNKCLHTCTKPNVRRLKSIRRWFDSITSMERQRGSYQLNI